MIRFAGVSVLRSRIFGQSRQRWREDSGLVAIPLNYSLLLTSNGEV
jgi:hypothetical protein